MDPWGTPALLSVHEKYQPFEATYYILLLRTSVERVNNFPPH